MESMNPDQLESLKKQALKNARVQITESADAKDESQPPEELEDFDEQNIDVDNWSAASDYQKYLA